MKRAPVAVSVVTGFLGAGKTTLVNRLLRDPALADTAVIVNEFGAVAIDHLLVERASEGIVELAGGCLCCTVRGELVDTLADLLDRVETGRIARLKRIVVETSGLADPVPVLQSIMAHPALVAGLRLDGVITLVDAVNGSATLDEHEEAVNQVAVADRIVVTKAALPEAGDRNALTGRLRAINPRAPVVDGDDAAALPASLLHAGLADPETREADIARWLGEPGEAHDHHDHGDRGHEHHDHAHDARVSAVMLTHDRPLPLAALETFLDLLLSTGGDRILRLKGVVLTGETPERPLVIHGVRQMLHPPARLDAWPQGPRATRIVIIGSDLDEDYVRRLFGAVTGEAAPDTADRAALADNPLAVPGMRF